MTTDGAHTILRRPASGPAAEAGPVPGRHPAGEVQVDDAGDAVEIRGLSLTEVTRAVRLLFAAEQLQDRFEAHADAQVLATMAGASMPLVRSERAAATARTAQLRQQLLADADNWLTYADLAALRDAKESSTRTWVARKRDAGELFTVQIDGGVLIPSVQLSAGGQLRPEIGALVREFRGSGLDGWSLWAWLTSPSDWLSGEIPSAVAETNGDRAVRAARRYAATIREGRQAQRGTASR